MGKVAVVNGKVEKNEVMKQFQILLLIVALSGQSVMAQRFTFDPSNTWEQEYYKDDYSSNQIMIINETNEALSFRWKLVNSTFPDEWSFSICDLGACFPVPPDSNDMSVTSVGGDAYFICHSSYNGFVGAGEIQLFLFEIGDEANGDTVTFRYSTTGILETTPLSSLEKPLTIFPNPATDIINLKTSRGNEISHVIIYNILGQPVFEKNKEAAAIGQAISIVQLEPGQYFVTVLYANGDRETKRFYKSLL